jgi:SpoVK/Ycf46/Vps4 family AAA+-type ATPase
LLSGPPGTGKTMVAGLLAWELGLDLYRVDLSKVVSKYIGETDKQLAMLFDMAETGHVMILFDEADSLFGKRTTVKSSNDRYANQETNYLLQRLEAFTGVCVLTTNHESAIDDAFRRRLAMQIRFTMPGVSERRALWRSMLPPTAPQEQDIDFETLAHEFELGGGHIKNAALRAAFRCAESGRPIARAWSWESSATLDLRRAATLEYESLGRVTLRRHG